MSQDLLWGELKLSEGKALGSKMRMPLGPSWGLGITGPQQVGKGRVRNGGAPTGPQGQLGSAGH